MAKSITWPRLNWAYIAKGHTKGETPPGISGTWRIYYLQRMCKQVLNMAI